LFAPVEMTSTFVFPSSSGIYPVHEMGSWNLGRPLKTSKSVMRHNFSHIIISIIFPGVAQCMLQSKALLSESYPKPCSKVSSCDVGRVCDFVSARNEAKRQVDTNEPGTGNE
jgi:hypothetical protein